jgi:hypothetical protein
MVEVLSVFVQLEAPKGKSPGKAIEGCYIVDSGMVILTNRRGEPVQDDSGKKYTQKLGDGDNPKQIAARLTKQFRGALRGNNAAPHGFSGPIEYPKSWKVV